MPRSLSLSTLSTLALSAGLAVTASAQVHKDFLTGPIDETHTMTLAGNVRPEVTAANDRGLRPDSSPMPPMQLVLHRSAENQAAFESYLAQLSDPTSPNFQKYLTNAEIGSKFGPSANDIARVSRWLTDKGLTVNSVSPDAMVIEFVGTSGQVRAAFNAPIHNLSVNGEAHFANVSDPQVPAALGAVVSGVASFANFKAHPMHTLRTTNGMPNLRQGARSQGSTGSQGSLGDGPNYEFLSAADLATIYNFNPVFASGITGKGQTIAVVEDSDQYSLNDWQVFRKNFGLTKAYPYGTLKQVNPTGTNTCADPGANGDDAEAAIDVDWATAAAPNAAIISAGCDDTTNYGPLLALANLLQESTPPKIVSISYGTGETQNGAAENLYINNLYQTAVAEGVSVFVSSGDQAAAVADRGAAEATHGIVVSGWASTPYNVAVGGTDFGSTYLNQNAKYWSSTNLANYRTALSYVPEIPWNDSCGSQLLASYEGYTTTYGPSGFCNSSKGANFLNTTGGSGGPSECATGVPSTRYVVSGSCKGYAKPTWQQGLYGNPTDGVRDLPDVSLFASNGFWEAYYATCISDPNQGFTTCSSDPSTWAGFGGTSVSSPIWAGIQALVNQSTSASWGNPNPVLYTLAKAQYGTGGSANCNSTLGSGTASNCVFYDVTLGDMVVPCTGTYDCFLDGASIGVLSTSDTSYQPAYGTTPGYDFATGIGTTNVTNLVNAWTAYSTSDHAVRGNLN